MQSTMTEPARLSPEEQNEIIRNVCSGLIAEAPEDWQELRYRLHSTVDVDSPQFQIVHADGRVEAVLSPRVVRRPLNELRDGMYLQGKGTWFTVRITVSRPGRYEVDYNYDDEPGFVPQVVPATFDADLKHYPRSQDNIPDWLRDMVAQA